MLGVMGTAPYTILNLPVGFRGGSGFVFLSVGVRKQKSSIKTSDEKASYHLHHDF